MGTYRGRRVFRAGSGMILVVVVSTMIPAVGVVMTYREHGWTWLSIGLACVTLLGVAGIVETLIFRIQLTDEALVVTDLRGRRSYPVKAIDGVYEAKGVTATLILSGGRKVNLPPVGSSLGNSIRSWLKHSS